MDPILRAVLTSWPVGPWTLTALLATAWVYIRGFRALRRAGSTRITSREAWAFLAGLFAIFIALESPIEPLASLLLSMHMAQHLLLILVAAPLLVLGAPEVPLLLGLPQSIRRFWIVPLLRWPTLRAAGRWLIRPSVAWTLSTLAVWVWHIPAFYGLALNDARWHYVEHASFLITAILFWWVVIEPYPARPRGERWLLLPYLFLAAIQGGVLAALLTFASRVIYPHYIAMPRVWSITPLRDQELAGAMMWVAGIVGYLIPAVWIGARLLYGNRRTTRPARPRIVALPVLQRSATTRLDLLHVPLIGRLLRWRFTRSAMQFAMLILAAAVVADGFRGPQVAPLNLAGTLPWIHWRGLLVIGLLAVGNVFCMACPFTLPQRMARRWLPEGIAWPRHLRSKWPAAGLLLTFFVAYEACDLWSRPPWTAGIIVVFFVAAFAVDAVFRPGSFCKFVCPIGQFNFVNSLISPFDVAVRSHHVCADCTTRECIRGSDTSPGCELNLFVPRKSGGLDCTLCLDCVHACPHDNIGLLAVTPGIELWRDRLRSGIGRLSRRPDMAALTLLLVFAAFVNAAGMVAPVLNLERQAAAVLGVSNRAALVASFYILALVALPATLIFAAALASRRLSRDLESSPTLAIRYAYAFIPLGFAMWLAHYGFHLATSAGAAVPASARFLADLGMLGRSAADIACNCCAQPADWLMRAEIIALDIGLLLSLYALDRIAAQRHGEFRRRLGAIGPWAGLMVGLFVAGIWILFQPMEMRGTVGAIS